MRTYNSLLSVRNSSAPLQVEYRVNLINRPVESLSDEARLPVPFGNKFISNKHGRHIIGHYQDLLYGTNGEFVNGRSHTFYRTPFDVTRRSQPSSIT